MFCKKCGAEIVEDAKFCPNCGASREEKIASESVQQNTPPLVNKQVVERTNGINKRIILIAVLVLVLIGGAFSLFGGGNKSGSSKNAVAVKSEVIVDDYIRDSATAKDKYNGKTIKITGKVLNKNQFNNDVDFCVTLYKKTVGGKRYSVSLAIPVANINEVNKLKAGDFVSAEGRFIGIVPQKDPLDVSIQINAKVINGATIK